MNCSNCGICCTETEMLLSARDIRRLESKGYQKSSFACFDKTGYATLKNRDGYCVFYDLRKRRCSEYVNRPSGCRIYPVILDEDKGIILDSICESRNSISEQEKVLKGRRVIRLLKIIDAEAFRRRE